MGYTIIEGVYWYGTNNAAHLCSPGTLFHSFFAYTTINMFINIITHFISSYFILHNSCLKLAPKCGFNGEITCLVSIGKRRCLFWYRYICSLEFLTSYEGLLWAMSRFIQFLTSLHYRPAP